MAATKYSRDDLKNKQFGPYEVKICDLVFDLSDGTKLSAKFWFPGLEVIPEAKNVEKYCDSVEGHTEDEVG